MSDGRFFEHDLQSFRWNSVEGIEVIGSKAKCFNGAPIWNVRYTYTQIYNFLKMCDEMILSARSLFVEFISEKKNEKKKNIRQYISISLPLKQQKNK
jgi:hypothetical protein